MFANQPLNRNKFVCSACHSFGNESAVVVPLVAVVEFAIDDLFLSNMRL